LAILCTLRSYRSTRTSLFDGIEEGGIRATSYSSHEIDEQENDGAIDGLQDRVSILKRVLCHLNFLMF
jgi:blocked early in transport 1